MAASKLMITIHTDGGARGNPGPSGAGAFIEVPGKVPEELSKFLGHQTNNWAEYEALFLALMRAKEIAGEALAETEVLAYLDSELVVKQLLGIYRVREATLMPQWSKVREVAQAFKNVRYTHVRREQNKDADRLANEAMDRGQ